MVTGPDRQGLEDAEDIYDPLHVWTGMWGVPGEFTAQLSVWCYNFSTENKLSCI
jgi:hypothetical protein